MLKARLFGVFTLVVMPTFIFTGFSAESMKGGMLMNNKHIATYGKENHICNRRNSIVADSFFHKSRVTAIAVAITL